MRTMRTMLIAMMAVTAVAMAEPPAQTPEATTPPAPNTPPRAMPDRPREPMRRPMMGDADMALMRMLTPDSAAVKELGLTEDQMVQIKAAMAPPSDMREIGAKMEQLSQRQVDLLNAETLDEEAILKVVREAGDLRTQTAEKRIKQMIAAYKLLTPEQRTKLRDLAKQRMDQARERAAGAVPGAARERGLQQTPPPPPPAAAVPPPQ